MVWKSRETERTAAGYKQYCIRDVFRAQPNNYDEAFLRK